MNSKFARACGVAAALIIPAGGLAFVAGGSAGATTPPQLVATFTSTGQVLTCATGSGSNYTGCTTPGVPGQGTVTISGKHAAIVVGTPSVCTSTIKVTKTIVTTATTTNTYVIDSSTTTCAPSTGSVTVKRN